VDAATEQLTNNDASARVMKAGQRSVHGPDHQPNIVYNN